MAHTTARLTPFGRRLLVDRIEMQGWPVAHTAESMGVSHQTAYKWLRRWRSEGESGLVDRSSRPHHCPTRISEAVEQAVVTDRVGEREGPHLMAGRLGMPRSTIYAVLKRRGLSRLRDLDRSTGIPIWYVKDCPGELVHVDIKKLGRVPYGGGWKVIGRAARDQTQKPGYEFCHSMVDDHSRVAYTEVLDRDDAEAAAGFMLRAATWFAGLGYRIDRVMTDNAFVYTRSHQFATALDTIGATQTHPPLPAPDQRQRRTIPPDPRRRMGIQTALSDQPPTTRRTRRLHRLIQSHPTPQ